MEKPINGKQVLVSVIVPVYNVEAYLCQCIESILCQTYPYFELLLIDDGSTDQSGRICREAADRDPRVYYYLKKNGGLSDARNYGMERAGGDYLTFIDSDDTVAETYLEILLDLCLNWSAGISCVDFAQEREQAAASRPGRWTRIRIGQRIRSKGRLRARHGIGSKGRQRVRQGIGSKGRQRVRQGIGSGGGQGIRQGTPNRIRKSKAAGISRGECLNSIEALRRCLVRDGFGVSAAGKMYHRSLIPVLHFPEGRRYEDLLTIPRLFEKCDRVACSRDRLYHYRIREGSLTHRRLEEEDILQTKILLDLIEYVDEYAPEIHDAAVCRLTEDAFHNIIYRLVFDDRYPWLAREISKVCGEAFRESRCNPYLTWRKKLQVLVFCHVPAVYGPCIRFYLNRKASLCSL